MQKLMPERANTTSVSSSDAEVSGGRRRLAVCDRKHWGVKSFGMTYKPFFGRKINFNIYPLMTPLE